VVTLSFAGGVTTGGVLSATVTVNGVAATVAASVQFTVVGPRGNWVPDAGVQVYPVSSNVTIAPAELVASTVKSPGRTSTRADASGVPHNTSTAQAAIRPLTLIL
jgi:hypothetical protein